MKVDRKGFMASAVLYVLLGLFISLMIGVVLIYSNRKVMNDKIKNEVTKQLEQNDKSSDKTGDREDYFKAARAYMKTNSKYSSFIEENDVSFIDVNSLINEGLLPKDIVSPLTNRKEITQNNYVVAVVNGDDYTFSYVDNATAKDYISVVNNLEKRVTALEDTAGTSTTLLNRTYPIGSIYTSTTLSTPAQVQASIGGVWEVYGSGRSLVGVNTSDANFNTVNKTGGSTTTTLTTANLPAHTHSIPALSGTAASAGAHTHPIPALSGSTNSAGNHYHAQNQYTWNSNGAGTLKALFDNGNNYGITTYGTLDTGSAGAHSHTVTTTASTSGSSGAHTHTISTVANTTGSAGSTTAFSNLGPYITVYMYKRTA